MCERVNDRWLCSAIITCCGHSRHAVNQRNGAMGDVHEVVRGSILLQQKGKKRAPCDLEESCHARNERKPSVFSFDHLVRPSGSRRNKATIETRRNGAYKLVI